MTQIQTYKKIDFIESIVYRSLLSNDGKNLSIWCPFCKHENKSKLKLAIHLEKDLFHCWLCGKKGSDISYLINKINPSKQKEALALFPKKYKKSFDLNINLFNEEIFEIEEEQVNIPNGFSLLTNAFSSNNPDTLKVFKYAVKRGVDKHKMWMLRLGYSNDPEFRRSLIIPSLDKKGDLNFYTSRNIDVDSNSPIKYKNANVSKKNVIFNEINIDWNIPLTLVEGPLDLLKTNDNATCLLGSSLTEDMLLFQEIVKNKTKINLALDSDVYHKSLKIAKLLTAYDVKVNILDTRIADDVGDMSKSQFNQCLTDSKEFKQNDSLLAKISQL
tara:strand:- start:169 stop:1155 length:987 start_codon:yes stop_codon:yes gene_type:complete